MLAEELPATIAAWSGSSPMHVAEKKHDLEQMFKSEQKRVADAWLVNECVTKHWTETLLPNLAGQMARDLGLGIAPTGGSVTPERRAGFDDIPGVIDLVLAEQRSAESRRALAA